MTRCRGCNAKVSNCCCSYCGCPASLALQIFVYVTAGLTVISGFILFCTREMP